MSIRLVVPAICAVVMVASSAAAQAPTAFAGVLGGAAFGEQTAPIFGVQGGVRVGAGLHIIGEAGWLRDVLPKSARNDFDIVEAIVSLNQGTTVELSPALRAMYAFGGARWSTHVGRVSPFVEGGAGAARLKLHVDADIGGSPSSAIEDELNGDESDTKPVVAAGGGLSFNLMRHWSLDAGYRYTHIFTDDPSLNSHAAYGALKLWF